jgi:TonB family protein
LLTVLEIAMLLPSVLLAQFIVVNASFLACLAGTLQGPEIVFQHSPSVATEPNSTSVVVELDRAILVLKRGLQENWATREQYLTAFEKTPSKDAAGRPATDAKEYVECAIGAHLRTHQIWDEGSPLEVEVQRTIVDFTKQRAEAEQEGTAEFRSPPCGVAAPRKVAVSAGVAAGMIRTKIDPVYPAEALKDHVSGTVVLLATISTKGGVESLRVISGPASLQQVALDAVRQWTYRPYLLNNTPVEVETTINVVFVPNH